MRLSLTSILSALIFSCPLYAEESADLGTVMYVGDSITHGVNSASYRWELHKILVDNGIDYKSAGVKVGNMRGGVLTGTKYGGRAFDNLHASQASARAYEIAGRRNAGKYGRFGYSNIANWLGQGKVMNNNRPYTWKVFRGKNVPDVYVVLIGTNDLLSDGDNSTLHTRLDTVAGKLRGDLDSIVTIMRKSNPKAKIYMLTLPCWTSHANGNSNETHGSVETWNKSLAAWANGKEGVQLIDVNPGLLNVATDKVFYGLESMFNRPGVDGLHPNSQGDLIIAGHVARAMNIAGRTAGQKRKAAAELAVQAESPTVNYVHDRQGKSAAKGFTCDVLLSVGDGKKGGWNTNDSLNITVGDGVLSVNEAYIKWDETILYSADMSANTDNLRVAYVPANEAKGLKGGYYVWLGYMLIGEALPPYGGENKLIAFKKNGNPIVNLKSVAIDDECAYAPSSSARHFAGFISNLESEKSHTMPVGVVKWRDGGRTYTGGVTGDVYGNRGNFKGDVWMSVSNTDFIRVWTAAHGDGGTLDGNAYLRFTKDAAGGGSVFGAVNAVKANGMVYVELSAPDATFWSFTNKNPAAVVGAYKTDITRNVIIVVNEGTFNSGIMGGIHSGDNTIGSHVEVYLNGGNIKGGVMAGGASGDIKGNTSVTVTGTALNLTGNIIAGGTGGKIMGKSMVCLQNMSDIRGPFANYRGIIDGGKNVAKERTLVLNNVMLPLLRAKFFNFDNVWVRGGTFTKISSLGGAKYISIDEASGIEVLTPSDVTEIRLRNDAAFVVKALTAPKVVVDINGAENFNFALTKIPKDVKNIVFKKDGKEYPALMEADTQADTAIITPQM